MKSKYTRDQRTVPLLTLYSPAERKALAKAAFTANVSAGEFVRQAVAEKIARMSR